MWAWGGGLRRGRAVAWRAGVREGWMDGIEGRAGAREGSA